MNQIGIFGGEIMLSRPFRFLLVIASALIVLSAAARAQNIDYGPYHNGEKPGGPCPTSANIQQDLPILAAMGNVVRVYSVAHVPCNLDGMVRKLLAYGLKVIPSAFLCGGCAANVTEVNDLIALLTSLSADDRAKIPFVVVGSEAVSFNGMTWCAAARLTCNGPNDLKPIVLQVKAQVPPGVKVTTAEIYYQYLAPTVQPCVGGNGFTDLGNTVDVIFVNIFPYDEGFPLVKAVDCILNVYGSLRSAYPLNKPIVISETGWPSLTSVADQQTFWQSFIAAARQNNIEYFGFEAFDEKWKIPPPVEATWGLWGANRQPKGGIVSFNPLALQVSPAINIAASGTQGGPFSPSSFSYALRTTSGSVSYSITNLPSWITASSVSGTVTTTKKTITFKINSNSADKLLPNTYVSSIAFNNLTNNQGNTTLATTLTVNPK